MTFEALVYVALGLVGAAAILRLLAGGGRRALDLRDPDDQLVAVGRARFAPRPIMNRSEFARFAWLDAWSRDTPYRLFTQVSYGEIIRSDDAEAHASINAKRADFVLVDRAGHPALVIEYQGSGHYRGNARKRDAVKRAALAKAGVPMIELFPKDGEEAVISKVEDALG